MFMYIYSATTSFYLRSANLYQRLTSPMFDSGIKKTDDKTTTTMKATGEYLQKITECIFRDMEIQICRGTVGTEKRA